LKSEIYIKVFIKLEKRCHSELSEAFLYGSQKPYNAVKQLI